MQPTTSRRNKSKYQDIYDLIERSGFTSDYVRELHQYRPKKYTIKLTRGLSNKRLYSISEMGLGIEVSQYIKDK